MNKMILVVDNDLMSSLVSKGFKIIKQNPDGSTIFALDNKLTFNFAEVDKSKFTFINRLTF